VSLPDRAAARDILIDAARQAGDIALAFFRDGARTSARVDSKAGGSPVTEADLAANVFLQGYLAKAFPDAGWLSEETADNSDRLALRRLVIVDPIDGTRAFLTGDPRWAVAIALIEDGRPVAAVVHAPALERTFAAAAGFGGSVNGAPLRASGAATLENARAAGPRVAIERMAQVAAATIGVGPKIPSLAYRLALVAEGALEFALASSDAHDWDVAAADLLLVEAGASLTTLDGAPLLYNQARTRHGVLLGAPHALIGPLVEAARGAGLDAPREAP
jgi:myo-inositol-1(or 4)-monophosphatase